jgi:rhodanese-related sulfurtransferase
MNTLFENIGMSSNGIIHVSPKEAYELCNKGTVLVDVREEFMLSYKKFGVKNILYSPYSELQQNYTRLPNDKCLIFADASGLKSKQAVLFLLSRGFIHIANLAGGIVEWERDGLPLQIESGEKLSGSCLCQLKTRNKK